MHCWFEKNYQPDPLNVHTHTYECDRKQNISTWPRIHYYVIHCSLVLDENTMEQSF